MKMNSKYLDQLIDGVFRSNSNSAHIGSNGDKIVIDSVLDSSHCFQSVRCITKQDMVNNTFTITSGMENHSINFLIHF